MHAHIRASAAHSTAPFPIACLPCNRNRQRDLHIRRRAIPRFSHTFLMLAFLAKSPKVHTIRTGNDLVVFSIVPAIKFKSKSKAKQSPSQVQTTQPFSLQSHLPNLLPKASRLSWGNILLFLFFFIFYFLGGRNVHRNEQINRTRAKSQQIVEPVYSHAYNTLFSI